MIGETVIATSVAGVLEHEAEIDRGAAVLQ